MRSLSMTSYDVESSNKCAEALENENCTVRYPETVKPATATKIAAKRRESTYNMAYIC